jgi:cysteine-rich repeat protein
MARVLVVTAAVCGLLAASCVYLERRLEGRACATDADCLEGYACWHGHCVEPGTAVDSGLSDSGASDATSADLGVVDTAAVDAPADGGAAADTALVDTASVDTASVDTLLADTATVDTPIVDAPIVDTPIVDVAIVDTAAVEAATGDSSLADSAIADTSSPDASAVDAAPDATSDAASVLCGNGADDGEACDDGDREDNDGCSASCQVEAGWNCTAPPSTCFPICGDGLKLSVESCETGGFADSPSCDYDHGSGPQACTAVVCGDGYHNTASSEECDDGNLVDTDACTTNCTLAACGDGHVWVGHETCDDHNTLACGTCSADCSSTRNPQAATGSITAVAAADLVDGETFALDDGVHAVVVFEFDKGQPPPVVADRIAVDVATASDAPSVAQRVVSAINSVDSELLITATESGSNALLAHDQPGTLGNQPIVESVGHASFAVVGMNGGAARDCISGVGCTESADCLSNNCVDALCQ